MTTRLLVFLLLGSLTALAAWLVHMPNSVQADEVPEKYRDTVAWLMDRSKPSGLILSEHPSESDRYLDSHGLAMLFLAGTFDGRGSTEGKSQYEVLTQAVRYIVKSQSGQGGWYHTSKLEGHDLDTIFLVDFAAALACRFCPNDHEERKLDEKTSQRMALCESKIPRGKNVKFGRDELANYYYAQAARHYGVRDEHRGWHEYRTAMFDHLKASQNKDGSWPSGAATEGGIGGGALYSTALWCTVLQLDRRSHPCLPRIETLVK